MIDYTLTRSKRKTIGLYVRDGRAYVRAPLNCPKVEIDKFVVSKEKWLTDKLAKSQNRADKREAFELNYGVQILFRGAEYPIVAKDGKRTGFDGEQFYLPPSLDTGQIKEVCIQIYRRLAKVHLKERVALYAKQMGVSPTAIKITSAKTRWGSCSSRRSINFSWRLIMACDDVIDYVVVHELAHLIQMNHSPRFWAIVEGVLPDYKGRQVRLKELQRRLSNEDWG